MRINRTIHLAFIFFFSLSRNNGHNVCEDLETEVQTSIRLAFHSARPPSRVFGNIMVGQILSESIGPFTSCICTCFDFTCILLNSEASSPSGSKRIIEKPGCLVFFFKIWMKKNIYFPLKINLTFCIPSGRRKKITLVELSYS